MNIHSDKKLNKELRKIRKYQKTKSIILNEQINTLINSLNKFNNQYSILINKFENKIKTTRTQFTNSLIDLETVDKSQKVLIDQMIKLNNVFSLTNNYIENFQKLIDTDMKTFQQTNNEMNIDSNILNNPELETQTDFREQTLQLSTMYISTLLNNISYEIPFDNE